MPISFQVDRVSGVVRTTVTGPFLLSDVRRYLGEAVDAKVFSYPEIIDARTTDATVWQARDLLTAANLVRDAFSGKQVPPRVMVVSTTSHFGQARMFAGFLAGAFRLAVFTDMVEAERWLAAQMADQEA